MEALKYKLLVLFLGFTIFCQAQEDGEFLKPETGTFLLQNATLVTVTQGMKENTDLLIVDGLIQRIGKNLASIDAQIIDCTEKFVYPGFIDSGNRLGLVEVSSVAETQDFMEIGNVTPNMQALTAVNPNSVAIPVTRVNGVTSSIALPSGGLFPGTAALIHLNGYTPDQMYGGFKAILLNFPSSARTSTLDNRTDEKVQKEAEEAQQKLDDIWERAVTYQRLKSAGATLDYYPEMEHLSKVIAGEITLLIEVNAAVDIRRAIKWVQDKNVTAILSGVSEGWRIAEEIASSGLSVITGPVLTIPTRQSDRYDAAYTNPGLLAKAGVKVALRTNDAENVRNLPFHAGFAAAYGMGIEEALKAVTIHPAEMFGIADQVGSLEEGKFANLFISDGDPFEPRSQISHLFIKGYKIPMTNRQIRLYQEFNERSPGLEQ
ncbi:amidohydrolase family protein [Lunatibacter salilacus]|uniref:amidohydrolase family protein n=1 Tax=Lunatibacter salilacus TaxID=2483804 RepID=UPI00131AC10B|nr:amidohydrolase family protein [Lunatibacter salilacus]